MEFFMDMNPPRATAQMKKAAVTVGGRVVMYDPPQVRDMKTALTVCLSQYRPEAPMEGPLALSVWWMFPLTRRNPGKSWKTTRPDTDNLVKALKDCMTKLEFWHDDAQVCLETVLKMHDGLPGILVRVESLEDMTPPIGIDMVFRNRPPDDL